MKEQLTVKTVKWDQCFTRCEYYILVDVRGEEYSIYYLDAGNNAEFEEDIEVTAENPDNDVDEDVIEALYDWVSMEYYNIGNGDVIEIDLPPDRRPLKQQKQKQEQKEKRAEKQRQNFEENIKKIQAHPASPKPRRRPTP